MSHLVGSAEVLSIIERTLNCIDSRLIQHGERVAFLVLRMLDAAGVTDDRQVREACMLTLLHDVGAYKTEEIERMVQFESREIWEHSIYGYLFLKYLSPLSDTAEAVLFHHMDSAEMDWLEPRQGGLAQLIHIADRTDTYLMERGRMPGARMLERNSGTRFSEAAVSLLRQAEAAGAYGALCGGGYRAELARRIAAVAFTEEEIEAYLRMVSSSIDFRSPYTVTHTITTEQISVALARRMGLEPEQIRKVRYGSALHDLGKVAIPVEILEFPGKLSPQAMRIMRTHVTITEQILGGSADGEMLRIAARHHEKLDGSGYPRGLVGAELTRPERIVAVADITSALCGVRSYKQSYDGGRVRGILLQMKQAGQLCPAVVDTLLDDYDGVMAEVDEGCAPVLEAYRSIQEQYQAVYRQMTALPRGGNSLLPTKRSGGTI